MSNGQFHLARALKKTRSLCSRHRFKNIQSTLQNLLSLRFSETCRQPFKQLQYRVKKNAGVVCSISRFFARFAKRELPVLLMYSTLTCNFERKKKNLCLLGQFLLGLKLGQLLCCLVAAGSSETSL